MPFMAKYCRDGNSGAGGVCACSSGGASAKKIQAKPAPPARPRVSAAIVSAVRILDGAELDLAGLDLAGMAYLSPRGWNSWSRAGAACVIDVCVQGCTFSVRTTRKL
jgi:hypothetical protein